MTNQAMRDVLTSTLAAEVDVIRVVSDGVAALAAATHNLAVVFVATCSDLETFYAARETGFWG